MTFIHCIGHDLAKIKFLGMIFGIEPSVLFIKLPFIYTSEKLFIGISSYCYFDYC